jgi:hypothetical protein
MSKESEADPDLSFATAADLRSADDESDGPFENLQHPERTFQRAGGMQYEGATVIELRRTAEDVDETALATLAREVLVEGPYRFGDWFDLPLPVFLVHDDRTGDTFRVAVRDDAVELHVRSATGAEGLRRFRDRLVAADGSTVTADWQVTRRTG